MKAFNWLAKNLETWQLGNKTILIKREKFVYWKICNIALLKKRKQRVFEKLKRTRRGIAWYNGEAGVMLVKLSYQKRFFWAKVSLFCTWFDYFSNLAIAFFNRHLNRGCLVYMFSLRFSGSKVLINLRRQFRVKFFVNKVLRDLQSFHLVFKITISKMCNLCCRLLFYWNFLINRLLISAFVLVNGIVFGRSNG